MGTVVMVLVMVVRLQPGQMTHVASSSVCWRMREKYRKDSMSSAVECVTTEKDRLYKEREGHQGNTRAGSYCVEVKSRWGSVGLRRPLFPTAAS